MTTSLADDIRVARLHALVDSFDGGTIQYWSGSRPANGQPASGTLQATSVLTTPAGTVANPANGIVNYTFGTIGDALRVDSADVKWARVLGGSGQFVMDVDVGLLSAPGSPPEEILLSSISGATGAFLHISTGSIAG